MVLDVIKKVLGIIASICVIAVNGYKIIKFLRQNKSRKG